MLSFAYPLLIVFPCFMSILIHPHSPKCISQILVNLELHF